MQTTVNKTINIDYRKEHPVLGFNNVLRQYYFMGKGYWLINNTELNILECWNKKESISDECQLKFKQVKPSDDYDVLMCQFILTYNGYGWLMTDENPCQLLETLQDIYNVGHTAGERNKD